MTKVLKGDLDTLDFYDFKRGYYRLIATNALSNLYPTSTMRSNQLYSLKIKASPSNHATLEVGGNISSTSLNQGFLSLSFDHLSKYPWKTYLGLDLGQFYTGAGLYFGQDILTETPVFYELMFNIHRFDYFTSSQSIFVSNTFSSFIQENETYLTANLGIPLSIRRNLMMKLGVTYGKNFYKYYDVNTFSKYDTPDYTWLNYFSPKLNVDKMTYNYKQYPTKGVDYLVELRYINAREKHLPGTTSLNSGIEVGDNYHAYSMKFYRSAYFDMSKRFTLGYTLDVNLASSLNLYDFFSTTLVMPAFTPTPHSKTLLLEKYRAFNYLGVAISPIFKFSPTIYLHSTASYFQPHKEIIRIENGNYEYSTPFPLGSFSASMALVWQSPIGPLSLSCSYYDNAEIKWYPQFNIGFLLTRNRGLRN